MKKKVRESNIELLRIVSMFLIVLCHACVHGLEYSKESFGTNYVIAQLLSSGGKLGVNIFILITGYFLYEQKMSISKICKLCKQIWRYSIPLFLIIVVFFNYKVNFRSIFEVLFSPLYIYWFATAYLLLMILVPFLNTLIAYLDEYTHRLLICTLFIFFSLLDFIFQVNAGYNSLSFFILLYLTGAYFGKKYDIKTKNRKGVFFSEIVNNTKYIGTLLLINLVLLVSSILIFDYLGKYNSMYLEHATYFAGQASPLIFFLGITIFLIFLNLKMNEIPIINSVASTMFAVYLLHDNKYFRLYFWNSIFDIKKIWQDSPFVFFNKLLFITLVAFVTCIVIEKIYVYINNKMNGWIK